MKTERNNSLPIALRAGLAVGLSWSLAGCVVVMDKDPLTTEMEKRCAIGQQYSEMVDGVRITRITRNAPVEIAGKTITLQDGRLIANGPNGEKILTNPDGSIIISETGKHWKGTELTLVRKGPGDGKLEFFRNCKDPRKPAPIPNKNDSEGFYPGRESKPVPGGYRYKGH